MGVTMDETKFLAAAFEAERRRLGRVAYRMLGSTSDAEDAVQEAWLRLSRSDSDAIDNLNAWLTTVVARVCLDMLRARRSRREEPLPPAETDSRPDPRDPEADLAMADSVGLAMLVVLETLPPPERIAFVLHDMFDLPFEEISPIVGKSVVATRQLASRARRRVKGGGELNPDLERQREVVNAYIEATRSGSLTAILAVLAPEVTVTVGGTVVARGPELVSRRAMAGRARADQGTRSELALVDGVVGIVVVEAGRLVRALRFAVAGELITAIEVIADAETLAGVVIGVAE